MGSSGCLVGGKRISRRADAGNGSRWRRYVTERELRSCPTSSDALLHVGPFPSVSNVIVFNVHKQMIRNRMHPVFQSALDHSSAGGL